VLVILDNYPNPSIDNIHTYFSKMGIVEKIVLFHKEKNNRAAGASAEAPAMAEVAVTTTGKPAVAPPIPFVSVGGFPTMGRSRR